MIADLGFLLMCHDADRDEDYVNDSIVMTATMMIE
jgi:hypothetical protein